MGIMRCNGSNHLNWDGEVCDGIHKYLGLSNGRIDPAGTLKTTSRQAGLTAPIEA
jgi:hypothetical protein